MNKISYILIFILLQSCNDGYQQTINGVSGTTFCLDTTATKQLNKIHIGKGTLTLDHDMTFRITSDSSGFLNIRGTWDLCCKGSDWGNYIFIPEGHIRQMAITPRFEVKVAGEIPTLVFTQCDNQ